MLRRFRRPGGAAEPRLLLLCFPHAGAGAALFRSWPAHLPADIEVVCPCLPGRDGRAAEAPLADMAKLITDLQNQVTAVLDRPYALYGHSLGAFIAFELAHVLRRQDAAAPVRLIVSGQRAPRLPYRQTPIYTLPDDEFLTAVRRRHQAIPEKLLADPAMRAYLTRLPRADFALVEAYQRPVVGRLPCPITAFGGVDDSTIESAELAAWSAETDADFRLQMMPGGHFFPQAHTAELLGRIANALPI
jgi:surfactin synthase thioesterase subunit